MRGAATPKDVDEYISRAPKEMQDKLNQLRATIKEVAPTAIEGISYRMPYYNYKGQQLAWFAPMKSHIRLYMRPPLIEEHKKNWQSMRLLNQQFIFIWMRNFLFRS